MRYRPLGDSGLMVSVTGLGCNNFGRRLDLDATLALAAQPGCTSVIAGATSPEQVKANAAAADWIPSAADLAELDRIVPPHAAL